MYDAAERAALAQELADAFLAAPWNVEAVAEAGAACLDRWPSWMEGLAMSVLAAHRTPPVRRPRPTELIQQIDAFLRDRPAPRHEIDPPRIYRLMPSVALPVITAPRIPPERVPAIARIDSVADLAQRLELSDGQLAWLADVRGLERSVTDEQLRNYRYRAHPRDGGIPRVIEAPKARLKEVQRWVLGAILGQVPPHDAAHGFTRGRSVVTHARLHTDQAAVLHLDLKDFFASVPAGRVYGIWRTLGYAPAICHALTGLCTNVVPASVWATLAANTPERAVGARFWLGRQLATPHLPQGAPTSPALANLAAHGLDRRLSGLAAASGLRYSRYADDLTFSGSERLHRHRNRFEALVSTIIRSEGFTPNVAKSAIQSRGGRQTVCGVVVNAHPNLARSEYDRLKATLHNAARLGPAGQNHRGVDDFAAHLLGRIAWVQTLNPARGEKLARLFARIDWT